jgi:hypothetical protein
VLDLLVEWIGETTRAIGPAGSTESAPAVGEGEAP